MKPKALLFILLLMYSLTVFGQNISGQWQGILNASGNQLHIIFHIAKATVGYSSTMDSPDQNHNGIPCDSVITKGDSIVINVLTGIAKFKGIMANDSTINGNWEQGGMKLALNLKKGKEDKIKITDINADSNCIESAIVLETKTGKIYGTLCLPKQFKTGPVALIIAGSGPTDRDGNGSPALNCDSYKILAHKLADNNIASLRYDKRGVAASIAAGMKESDLRFENYVSDAIGWVNKLKQDKRFTEVIIIGHSEGSLIGMLAAQQTKADKYISIAGAGESAALLMKRQLSVMPPEAKDTSYNIIDSLSAGKTVSHIDPILYNLFRPSVQPYLISWIKYNPAVEISKLTIPVLIIQGTNDLNVTVDDAKKLSESDKNAKLILLVNMNHVFRDVSGEDVLVNRATYQNPSLPVDSNLVTDICGFIKNKN